MYHGVVEQMNFCFGEMIGGTWRSDESSDLVSALDAKIVDSSYANLGIMTP